MKLIAVKSRLLVAMNWAMRWPMRHPRFTILIAACLVIASVVSMARLRPSGSLEFMMAERDPAALAFGKIARDFGSMDNLLLVATMPGDAATDASAFQDFNDRLQSEFQTNPRLRPLVAGNRSASESKMNDRDFFEKQVLPASLFYLQEDAFDSVLNRLTPQAIAEQFRRNEELVAVPGPAAATMGKIVLKDPLRLREIIANDLARDVHASMTSHDRVRLSKDKRRALIHIRGTRGAGDLDFTKQFIAEVAAAAERVNEDHFLLQYSGGYAIAATSERAIRSDMIRSVVGSISLLLVLFLLVYRRPLTFLLTFVPTGIAIVAAFGVYALIRRDLTPATAVVGAIIAGLGIDYSVHLLTHHARERRTGAPPMTAAESAASQLALPISLAACTSLLGLLAISQSSVRALRDFATLAGLGLAAAVIASLVLLPTILTLRRPKASSSPSMLSVETRITFENLTSVIARWPMPLLIVAVVVWIIAGSILVLNGRGLVVVESDLTVMHPRPNAALDLQSLIPNEFDVPANTFMIHLEASSESELMVAAHDIALAARSETLRSAGVTGAFGLSTLLSDPRVMDGRREQIAQLDADRVVADFRAEVERSIFADDAFQDYETFLLRLLTTTVPPTLLQLRAYESLAASILPRQLPQHLQEPFQAVSFLLLAHPITERGHRDVAIAAIRDAIENIPNATLTGMTVIAHDAERSIRHELQHLLLLAAAAVITLLVIAFRNTIDVLLILLPVGFGITIVLASMHALNDGLTIINVVGMPLLVGIGVDDGIFVMSIVRQHRRDGAPAHDLAPRLAASALAITLTSATTMVAFGTLVFTSTPAIQSLGRLTAIGVGACLMATLFLLMPLALIAARRRSRTNKSNKEFS